MAKKYLDNTGLTHYWEKTAYKYGIEYIVGTQSAATNVWTGVTLDKNCASSTIPTGKVIVYRLPYDGTNTAATLNLTLPDGTTSGAKNVKYNTGSNVGKVYYAGCDIFMIFDGTYWKCSAWYDSNNYDRIRHNSNVKAASAVTAGQIIVGTSAGYKPVANGVTFDINYPILYAGSAISAAAVGNNNYDAYPGVNLQSTKSGYTGTTYKMTFLVGTLSGTTFTVNSDIFTQTIPSSADGKVYAPIGLMTDSNKTVFFFPTNNYWEYRNGAFRPISSCPTLAAVATSGSYNDLSNKPTIPAAQVQSNWAQTTTTAVDYIKNKPTLATVATSGSYNDLSNKPTIPTVNNATLTIQKNGTTVKTFTANASSNVTANITVPTNNNELTNGAGYITSSGSITGNAATATKLAAGKTIALGTGATGTATSFDGSANITIPVTDVKDAYVTWGGKGIVNDITPDDMGCTDEFGHNKLAYLPASCINVAYSTNGGSTWTDYGATDAEKVKMVTTSGPGFAIGKSTEATSSNITNLKLRIRLACGTTGGAAKLYTAAKKILFNVNNQGAASKVHMRYRTIANYMAGTETWTDISTEYTVAGGSGWNSIPFAYTFGGNMSTQTGQIGEFEFVFSSTALGTWGGKKLVIYDIRLIGSTNWTMPSEMARAGHLYTVDEGQNATFPANVSVTGSLKHGSYTYTLPNKTGTVAMTSDLPTVNNATLTIQKNGTNVQTFTANQSTNATANITVPTKTSELTNNSGFLTSIPTASASTLGGVKVGTNLSIDANGVLSADAQSITVDTALSTTSTNPVQNKVITTALNSKADSSSVPTKISNLTNTSGSFITYCTCSTAAATAAKVVALDSGDSNWVLRKGAIIGVKFTNTNTASSVTLNVNSSGAKSIYYNNAAYTGSSNSICGYASRYTFYMYDGTYWVWISDSRHDGNDNTYTTAYCSTAAGTAAKAATMTGYTLTANRYTVITFTNANSSASALTLNINSKGAKPLYINGAASSASNYTLAAGSYIVYYNGTNYYINNNGEIPRMIHSESPVSTSAVTPIVTNSMISNGTITFSKTATGEFLKLTLTTTDPGAGSALAANTLLGVYE